MCPVTAESVNRQPMGNQTARLVVLGVVLLAAIGVIVWLVAFRQTKHKSKPHFVSKIGPIEFTAKNLKAESKYIGTKFFWAGPQQGHGYEFTRNKFGYLYVRYLPTGVKPGVNGARYLIVATYPVTGAYTALKKKAKARAVPGPGASIVYVNPKDHKSVYMAFPGIDDEIEIYSPTSAQSIAAAQSGKIKRIR